MDYNTAMVAMIGIFMAAITIFAVCGRKCDKE